jgi:hypothetical protein
MSDPTSQLPPPELNPPPGPPSGWRPAVSRGASEPTRTEVARHTVTVPTAVWFWTAIGAGVAAIIAAFLPWITVSAPFYGSISRSGIDNGGDGTITAVLGLVVVIVALTCRRFSDRVVGIVVICLGVAVGAIGAWDWHNLNDKIHLATSQSNLIAASVGVGLYVTIAAAIAAVVAGVLRMERR